MKSEYYSQVIDWMQSHRNEIVEDIKKIVNIKSVSDISSAVHPFGQGCKDVLDKMLELGENKGFVVCNYEYYCGSISLMSTTKDEIASTIGVWTHLDVVTEGDNWLYEPYNSIEKGGFLIGRGSQDNKSPAISILYVLQCIKELQLPIIHNLKLFVGCSEECGMQDVDYFVKHYPCPDLSLIADCGFPVCYAEKGLAEFIFTSKQMVSDNIISLCGGTSINTVPNSTEIVLGKTEMLLNSIIGLDDKFTTVETEETIKITAHGISKHAAFPQDSVNAIQVLTEALCQKNIVHENDYELISFLNIVNKDYLGTGFGIACTDEIAGDLICNGTVISMEHKKIQIKVNLRYPIFSDYGLILEKLQQTAEKNGYTIVELRNLKPVYYRPESKLVQTLASCYNSITGQNTKPYAMSGASYSRKLPNAIAFGMAMPDKGIQNNKLFVLGHGDYHQPDEGICIEQILESAAIYVMALLEMDKSVLQL